MSAKWLQGYLNEYAWRYNHREDTVPMSDTLTFRVVDAALETRGSGPLG